MGGAVLGGWSQPSPAQEGSGSPCWAPWPGAEPFPCGQCAWGRGVRWPLGGLGPAAGCSARSPPASGSPSWGCWWGAGGLTSGLGCAVGDEPSSGQRARGGWLGLLVGFGFQAQLELGVVPRPVPSPSLHSILHPLLRGAFRTQQPLPLSAGGDVVWLRGEWGRSPPWVLPPETSHAAAWGHLAWAGREQGPPWRAAVGKRHQCVEKQR